MLGTFWHPDVPGWQSTQALPAERVAGQFTTTSDRSWSLELLGTVLQAGDPSLSDPNMAVPNFDVIYGASSDQTCLSLFDTWRSAFTLFGAIQDKETWHVGWYAEGNAWLEPDDEVELIKIEYDLLSDWGWPHDTTGGYDHTDRAFHVPQAHHFTADTRGARLTLHLGWSQTLASHRYSAQAQSLIEIKDTIPLHDVSDKWVFPLQNLLSLLTLQYVDVEKVTAGPANLDAQVGVHYNMYKPSDLDERSGQDLHPIKMLATRRYLAECGIDLESLLNNYFCLIDNADHGQALWFMKESDLCLIDKTADASLLNAFRALERYHCAAIDGTAISETEHAARVATIVKGTPPEHQQWVRNQISGANKKGLRRQLHEVLENASSTEAKIVDAWPGFFDSIVELRSKVAHGIPATGGDAGLRYLAVATGLRWILRHVYLKELGLSDHHATETISNCLRFEQEVRLLRDWYQQLEQQ